MKKRHHKYEEVKKLVKADIPVLLSGGKGSGKSTLVLDLAEDLDLPVRSITMTRQTTLGMLKGFINVEGRYIPSDLYYSVRDGGIFLIEEINGADPNVLLALNTLENGYMSFNAEEGIIDVHPHFRLIATQNPNTSEYVGRAALDASTLDRFDEVDIDLDADVEKSIVSPIVYSKIQIARKIVSAYNSNIDISMRDSIRMQKRADLGMLDGFMEKLFKNSELLLGQYHLEVKKRPEFKTQDTCKTLHELVELLESRNEQNNGKEQPEKTPVEYIPF